jgi:hypothetical protein
MAPSKDGSGEAHHNDHDDEHHGHHHGKIVTSALDPEVEATGIQAILAGLSEGEKKELVDEHMPLRHFRADKVRSM